MLEKYHMTSMLHERQITEKKSGTSENFKILTLIPDLRCNSQIVELLNSVSHLQK